MFKTRLCLIVRDKESLMLNCALVYVVDVCSTFYAVFFCKHFSNAMQGQHFHEMKAKHGEFEGFTTNN